MNNIERALLSEYLTHDLSPIHRRPFVATVVGVGQAEVIEAHEVEDGRVNVVYVDWVFRGAKADFVG